MAVKLRLQRFGAKKRPYYRIVAADSRSPRDGRFIEIVGTYHPLDEENTIKIDEEKALKWLNNGAQPTDTVRSLLSRMGIMKNFQRKGVNDNGLRKIGQRHGSPLVVYPEDMVVKTFRKKKTKLCYKLWSMRRISDASSARKGASSIPSGL